MDRQTEQQKVARSMDEVHAGRVAISEVCQLKTKNCPRNNFFKKWIDKPSELKQARFVNSTTKNYGRNNFFKKVSTN